jgi:hypothetical protein
MQMRVRVSVLKAGLAVGEKGSALNVTDSRAIARVLAAWLSSTGFLFVAAATGQSRRRRKINVWAAQHAVRINEGLRFRKCSFFQVR